MRDTLRKAFNSAVAHMQMLSLLGSSALAARVRDVAPRLVPATPLRRRLGPHQGAQEMSRRRYQIERGILTTSNGPVLPVRDHV